jgi:HEPN domain-containing protein
MVPGRYPPDDPREWLNRARSNLIVAKAEAPGVYYEQALAIAEEVIRWVESVVGGTEA